MKARRFLAVLSVVAAAGVMPVVTAGPAQADPFDCVEYLKDQGYRVGPRVTQACGYNRVANNWKCVGQLSLLITNTRHISTACNKALGD
ncbi:MULTISPECIES: hypothetical protein [Streptomyces]|uniref:Secreted protein n=1 Tax=Streptomyces heilongjiangensis TaxID=945052 RepID=A0ABW1BCH0_9ACTN|nr:MULTISPECIES: hypothetical protein [Streptomyces]MDC2948688.1 hypothetical protein [Streptomyces heilongjiangensis]